MTVDDLVAHYGSIQVAAKAAGIDDSTVRKWRQRGVPLRAQYMYQVLTNGKLVAGETRK